jgi:hypothetical protein
MNQRIKELYKQSSNQDYFPQDTEEVYMSAKDLEKFAKLIVRECADIANSHFERKVAGYPGDKIEEHFGVK